jgi:hypothetical protein
MQFRAIDAQLAERLQLELLFHLTPAGSRAP